MLIKSREERRKYERKWYVDNKERVLLNKTKWRENNRNKVNESARNCYYRNIEKSRARSLKVNHSLGGRYIKLKYRHNKRWDYPVMTLEEFKGIVSEPCFYCGQDANYGIDRVDNLIGYIKSNSISCCKRCNVMKNDMPTEEFLNQIKRIYFKINK